MNDVGVLGAGGLVLLAIGGWSGLLLYVSLARPKGWAGIKEWTRLRQGHVDALIIGAVLVAADTLAAVDSVTAAVLLATGYYTAISTGALAWWPDLPSRTPWAARVDLICFTAFSAAWTWVAARAVTGW
ncbi:hypothetical protein [Streptomyces zingiberis]|uniref:DUF1761 domain-containing protein n=1 Tax=Streptomyces zingiberis TaxID=2053010 RepID=A0ABX1BWF3_9ACTN|nr:hypothetical protein [Streptomyces zingiberis]NJQ02041.1 hypothetical protein [Streptomyces zingiberis]